MARRTDPGGGPTRVTKAERKEQARRERLELMRKQAKRRTRRRIGIVLGSILVAGAVVAIVLANLGGGTTKKNNGGLDPKSLPGMLQTQATAANPWPANSQDAQARAAKIGLPPVGGAFHNHPSHAAHTRANRQIAAPRSGIEPSTLFDYDNVARSGGFDCRRAKVARIRPAFGAIKLNGEDTSGNAAIRRVAPDARD